MLDNKVALITGGSRGLGRNMAQQLSLIGADVVLTYRSRENEALEVITQIEKNGQKAAALQLDVSDPNSFVPFFQKLSEVLREKWSRDNFDFLINNAGSGAHALISETTDEIFESMLNVHFKGVFFLTQKALPLIADSGRIVNISSGLTRFTFPGYCAYSAMKGAIEVFTRYLAKELGDRGITANVVAPGAIDTDFTRPAFDANPQIKEMIASQTTLGRIGVPDDIGGVVAFLCSDSGRWVNGQRIEASGGIFL